MLSRGGGRAEAGGALPAARPRNSMDSATTLPADGDVSQFLPSHLPIGLSMPEDESVASLLQAK